MRYELIDGERYIVDENTGRKRRDNVPVPEDSNVNSYPDYHNRPGKTSRIAIAIVVIYVLAMAGAFAINYYSTGPTEQAITDYMNGKG